MPWETAFEQWQARPYPSHSPVMGTVDPVILDAALVGQLNRLQRGVGVFVVYELAQIRDAIERMLPHMHGECLSYFIEAVEVADLALAAHREALD